MNVKKFTKKSQIELLTENSTLVATILKSISHPLKLLILCSLIEGQKNVSEIMALCGGSQSQISQFLSKMRLEGLVNASRDGKFIFYSISDIRIQKLITSLQKIYCS